GAFNNFLLEGTSYVFSNVYSGDPHNVAEAIAHEAGHDFGLAHQSLYDANSGALLATYNPGNANTAPIMGNSYSAQRGLWWHGSSEYGVNSIQDDLAIIANAGFGYRADDHGDTAATASPLVATVGAGGVTFGASGIVESTSDEDWFSFNIAAPA